MLTINRVLGWSAKKILKCLFFCLVFLYIPASYSVNEDGSRDRDLLQFIGSDEEYDERYFYEDDHDERELALNLYGGISYSPINRPDKIVKSRLKKPEIRWDAKEEWPGPDDQQKPSRLLSFGSGFSDSGISLESSFVAMGYKGNSRNSHKDRVRKSRISLAQKEMKNYARLKKEIAAASTITQDDSEVNLGYQYEDQDINAILQLRAQEEGIDLNTNIILPPIGDLNDQLFEHLQEESLRYLAMVNEGDVTPYDRNIIIPLHLSNGSHWVGLIIRLDADGRVILVQYVDSLGFKIPPNIAVALQQLYGENILIENVDGLLQMDGNGCGPLTIENLIILTKGKNLSKKISDRVMRKIRKRHMDLATKYFSELGLACRQSCNEHYTVCQVMCGGGDSKGKIGNQDDVVVNSDYEYGVDDILLVIDRQLKEKGYSFQGVVSAVTVNSIFEKAEDITPIEDRFPAYIINGDNKKLSFENATVVLAGGVAANNNQPGMGYDYIKSFIEHIGQKKEGRYILVFPYHTGGSNNNQSGHWNLATLLIDFNKKEAEFINYEPLGEKSNGKIVDEWIKEGDFYKYIEKKLEGFKVKQSTIRTGQQNDGRLCGAIAAENFEMVLGDSEIINKQYLAGGRELRKSHIDLVGIERFTERQRCNYIFIGYKNDDFQKAQGEEIIKAIQDYISLNPDGDFVKEFTGLIESIYKQARDDDGNILNNVREFFKKYSKAIEEIKAGDVSLFGKFFKTDIETAADMETVAEYNVIEVLRNLADSFYPILIKGKNKQTKDNDENEGEYKRAQGYSNTYRGDEYQKLVGMKYVWDLYSTSNSSITLYTEKNEEGGGGFGKFDDLVIETDDYTEVVQVKHAGSIDKKKRVYTVGMLCGTDKESEADRNKKAALHIYFDSWIKLREQQKNVDESGKKEIRFVFYTNHDLDDSLKPFYDDRDERLIGLLESHKDKETEKIRKKIISSVYCGSDYFKKEISKGLLKERVVCFDVDSVSGKDWEKFINDNVEIIFNLLTDKNSKKSLTKTGGFKKLSKEDFARLNYLLIGCFGLTSDKLDTDSDFLQKDFSDRPIHKYLKEKLLELADKAKQDLKSVLAKREIKVNKEFTNLDILKDTEVSDIKKDKVILKCGDKGKRSKKNGDEAIKNNAWNLAMFFGVVESGSVKYNKSVCDLDNSLIGKFQECSKLPTKEFSADDGLDPLLIEFFKDYRFLIKHPSIEALEDEVMKGIGDHFQIEDLTYYYKFQEYFLKEFRSPIGHKITRATVTGVLDKARSEMLRSRLVGFSERCLERISGNKNSVVNLNNNPLEILDRYFKSSDLPVMIVKGKKYSGKSFTVAYWVKKNLLEERVVKEDGYAFVPVSDIWQSDSDVFAKKLNLFIVDGLSARVLESDSDLKDRIRDLVRVAKNHNKKLILICDDEDLDAIRALLSGEKYDVDSIEPLNNKQVLKLLGKNDEEELKFADISIKINDLLKLDDSGLAMVMRNPGYLLDLKNLSNKKLMVKRQTGKNNDEDKIYVLPDVTVTRFVKFLEIPGSLKNRTVIYDQNKDFALEKYFPASKFVIKNIADISEKDNDDKSIIIDARGICSLTSEQLEKFRQKKIILVTDSAKTVDNLFDKVDEVYYAPQDNLSLIIKIEQSEERKEKCHDEDAKDWEKMVLQRDSMGKRVLVSVDAGMGKSRTVRKLSGWKNDSGNSYFWVMPIYLDQIPEELDGKDLADIVLVLFKGWYADNFKIEKDKFPEWLETAIRYDLDRGNVLLLLDGGDQVSKNRSDGDAYKKLLNYKYIVLLTRPNQSMLNLQPNFRLTLHKFSEDQVQEYFKQAFPENGSDNIFYDKAIKFMDSNDELKNILGTPLQCYLLWQAWKPYYDQWQGELKENPGVEPKLPEEMEGRDALLILYNRFVNSKIIIYLQRNLQAQAVDLLENMERVEYLGASYVDRMARVAVETHFSGLSDVISSDNNLTPVTPVEWLDKDILDVALIKRRMVVGDSINYEFLHRTYQEYFAAKFFAEGLLKIRIIDPLRQTGWCNEFLINGRFIQQYQQFWRFVFQMVRFKYGNRYLEEFEKEFKDHRDLVGDLQEVYWDALMENESLPEASDLKFNDKDVDEADEKMEGEEGAVKTPRGKQFEKFEDVKNIIKDYDWSIFDDPPLFLDGIDKVIEAIRDLGLHTDISLDSRYDLLVWVKILLNKKPSDHYHVHKAIIDVLAQLWLEDKERTKDREIVNELSDYYLRYEDKHVRDMIKNTVLNAIKQVKPTKNNLKEFLGYFYEFLKSEGHAFTNDLQYIKKMIKELLDKELKTAAQLREEIPKFCKQVLLEILGKKSDRIEQVKILHEIVNDLLGLELDLGVIEKIGNPVTGAIAAIIFYPKQIDQVDPSVREIFLGHVNKIGKNSMEEFIDSLSSLGIDTYVVMKAWLEKIYITIGKNYLLSSTGRWDDIFKEVDGCVPAACVMRDGFNEIIAGYLSEKIKESYWQYPGCLARNIPFLLAHNLGDSGYQSRALRVYHEFLFKVMNKSEIFNQLLNHEVGVGQVMRYAWNNYQQHENETAINIIWLIGNRLHWPIFVASSGYRLILISPRTGQHMFFEADSQEGLDRAVGSLENKKGS